MTFRTDLVRAIRFDTRLRGTGAQVHNEVGVCLALRAAGKRLIYDPAILVDHYHGQRFDEDKRSRPLPIAVSNAAYNLLLLLLEYVGKKGSVRVRTWYFFVGTRDVPGLAQVIRMTLKRQFWIYSRWYATRKGIKDAVRDARMR